MRIGDPQAGQSRQAGRSTRSRSGGWRPESSGHLAPPAGTEDPHHHTLPDSQLCRPSFFERHPLALGPDCNHQLVALLGPCGGTLHAEPVRLERTLQITRVIADPELALDHGGNAVERPPFGGKARRDGTPVQQPPKAGPGFLIQAGERPGMGRASRPRGPSWARVAAQRQTLARLTPSSGRSGPGKAVPGATASRPPDAAPPSAQMSDAWPPNVVFHRAPPHEDRHRPMLHHLREDH